MMKLFFAFILFIAFFKATAQSTSPAQRKLIDAAKVQLPAQTVKNTAAEQATNWEMELNEHPQNANAWLNHYIWTERNKLMAVEIKKTKLANTITEAKQYILNTSQYYLMLFLQSGKKDTASIIHALSLTQDKLWLYPYAIQSAIITKNTEVLLFYCKLLNDAKPLEKSLYEYHYNVLMSAVTNATVYAQGLNDLVPLAILQQVYSVRKDIALAYYDGKVKTDAYLCLSLGTEIISQYNNAAYTGLLIKTNNAGIEELKNNVEKFDLMYLGETDFFVDEAIQLYKNYLPSFILLYKQYKATSNKKADEIRSLIEKIAAKTNMQAEVKKAME